MEALRDTPSHVVIKASLAPLKEDDMVQCPTCNKQIRGNEVAKHCEQEMESLRHLKPKPVAETATEIESANKNETIDERRKPWNIFQRVQRNRHSRLKRRTRKRSAPKPPELPCPVCNLNFKESEIQSHTEQCIRRSNNTGNECNGNSSNEDDDGEEYEEYEWAGQKRIRASSLLVGGYASLGIGQSSNYSGQQQGDEDEDLNVDEDDTQIFGPSQYSEADVIPLQIQNERSLGEDSDVSNYMRHLITGRSNVLNAAATNSLNNGANEVHAIEQQEHHVDHEDNTETAETLNVKKIIDDEEIKPANYYQQIIASLKSKLRQYENHGHSKFKCLICLDEYKNPAVSVACWHVHCEECWLRTLGARKLCPECNFITTPKDLRRIFI